MRQLADIPDLKAVTYDDFDNMWR